MYNVLKEQLMKKDSLRTTLCIFEQLMKDLPITAASGDIEDLVALTPNHFLAGNLNVTWPNLLFSGNPASYRRLYRDQQKLLNDIWNRGTSEDLPSLQQRNKCSKEELIIPNVGDSVWLIEKDANNSTIHSEKFWNYSLEMRTQLELQWSGELMETTKGQLPN